MNKKQNTPYSKQKPSEHKQSKQQKPQKQAESSKSYDDIIEGRNSVIELLSSDRDINKILIQKGEKHGSINKIIAMAKEKRIVTVETEKSK